MLTVPAQGSAYGTPASAAPPASPGSGGRHETSTEPRHLTAKATDDQIDVFTDVSRALCYLADLYQVFIDTGVDLDCQCIELVFDSLGSGDDFRRCCCKVGAVGRAT